MAEALDITSCDLQCAANNAAHHTELNGVDRLIVRRGQPFTITLHLGSDQYQPESHAFQLIAETGPVCSEKTGTKAVFAISDSLDETRWSAIVSQAGTDYLSLSICSSPNASIGLYTLTLEQGSRVNLGKFVLLFNAWCPRDAVYLENEEELKEYVLSQDGIIYQGTAKFPLPTPWNYGQFEPGILDACLRVLDENPKYMKDPQQDCSGRRNPIYVTRLISAMVNCNDDRGILLGRWDGSYKEGVSPLSWKGSVEILRQWNSTSCQPVRYGQCWVFAAVACSVSRALGIPCRVVTNFLSAHDTNGNLVIERYVDEEGKPLHMSRDMIWNYHCWIEGWMTRPDMVSGYDGWQASDPTPQEKSDGVYCCGPVSVKAIKEGELTFKYDAPFVFAEVNSDVATYILHKDGRKQKVMSTTVVGSNISTKGVCRDVRENITHLYKYPEGSEEEREAFKKASHNNKLIPEPSDSGLQIKIGVSPEMMVGSNFDVFAVIFNHTSSAKMCRFTFCSRTMSYNGNLGNECGFKDLLNLHVGSGEEKKVPLSLCYSKYGCSLTEDNLINLSAFLRVYSTDESVLAVKNIVLNNPDIQIKILGEPKENRKLAANLCLKNPLPEPLTNCCFSVEGANLTGGKPIKEMIGSTVGPGETVAVKVHFTPTMSGLRKLVVNFESDKLGPIKGYKNVIIGK